MVKLYAVLLPVLPPLTTGHSTNLLLPATALCKVPCGRKGIKHWPKVERGRADRILIAVSTPAASCITLPLSTWTCVNACPVARGVSTGSNTEYNLNVRLPLPFYLSSAKSSALGPEPDILCMTSG